jgi:hypothetical protein
MYTKVYFLAVIVKEPFSIGFDWGFDERGEPVLAVGVGKQGKNKAPLSVQVSRDLAVGLQSWLDRHPGAYRSHFVLHVLSVKLQTAGIPVPQEILQAVTQLQPRASAGGTPSGAAKFDRLKPGRKRFILAVWLDKRVLAAMDRWIAEIQPWMTRTTLFTRAAAEELVRAGLMTRKLAAQYGVDEGPSRESGGTASKTVQMRISPLPVAETRPRPGTALLESVDLRDRLVAVVLDWEASFGVGPDVLPCLAHYDTVRLLGGSPADAAASPSVRQAAAPDIIFQGKRYLLRSRRLSAKDKGLVEFDFDEPAHWDFDFLVWIVYTARYQIHEARIWPVEQIRVIFGAQVKMLPTGIQLFAAATTPPTEQHS